MAATIALGVVFSAVLTTRAEANRTDFGRAATAADKVRAEFERELAADPQFYLSRMFAYERPRKCLADATTSDISRTLAANPYLTPIPGATGTDTPAWPLDICGGVWDYPPPGESRVQTMALQLPSLTVGVPRFWATQVRTWNASDQLVRAEVRPNPDNGQVTLTVLAQVGSAEAGQQVTYGTPTVAEWALWSGSDLDMTALMHPKVGSPAANAVLGAGAGVYADGVLRVPTYGVSMSSATLAGERGVFGVPPSPTTTTIYSGAVGVEPFANRPAQLNVNRIRTGVPSALTAAKLAASAPGLDNASCGATLASAQNLSSKKRTSLLCLRPGQKVITASGVQVTVPEAAMMLVVPTGSSAATAKLKVFYAERTPVAEAACLLDGCRPTAMDARAAAAGAHIQSPLTEAAPWRTLGEFYYPSTGVVATGVDTVVGRCPAFATAGATTCGTDVGEPEGGWAFHLPVTVWAGSAAAPADVWVAGPVRTGSEATVGLVASGSLVLPSFASPAGVALPVSAQLVSLGASASSAPPLAGWPAGFAEPSLTVDVSGSLAAPALRQVSTVASLSVTPDAPAGTRPSPAPHLPGFSQVPVALTSRQVSSSEVCGSYSGSAGANTVTTCVGRW